MVGADSVVYRYLAWRPVGSPPIFSPSYTRDDTIDPKAEKNTSGYFDPSLLEDDIKKSFQKAEYRARYDGIYIMDLYFDPTKMSEFADGSADSKNDDQKWLFLDHAAHQISMIISTELKHPHYFHSPRKSEHPPAIRWGSRIIPSWTIAVVLAAVLFFLHGQMEPWLTSVASISVALLMALGFAYWVGDVHAESHIRYSPDKVLRIAPVRLSECDPLPSLQDLPLDHQCFLANLTCYKPENGIHDRPAIAQLRRNVLKIHEHINSLIVRAKQTDTKGSAGTIRLFWLGFFLAVISLGYAMVAMASEFAMHGFTTEAMQFSLGLASLVLLISGIYLVHIVISMDLPRVKLLRATSGFFSACEPLNDIISQILSDSDDRRLRRRSAATFAHVIKTIDTQLEGESQRMQTRQFWIAGMGTALGALIAAMAITFSIPANHPQRLRCEVTQPDPDGPVIQDCRPEKPGKP